MLQPVRADADDPKKTYACSFKNVPFELKAKRRDGKRGAPKNPVSAERNQAILDYYDRRMVEIGVGGYESVIMELKQLLAPHINESAIREAIKERSPKSGSWALRSIEVWTTAALSRISPPASRQSTLLRWRKIANWFDDLQDCREVLAPPPPPWSMNPDW